MFVVLLCSCCAMNSLITMQAENAILSSTLFVNPIATGNKLKTLLIYTGGTIGMTKNTSGLLGPKSGNLINVLNGYPELLHPDVPAFDILEWDKTLDSSDFNPLCWVTLARQIEEYYFAYDGFVILHGTDTMAYTASALSFMLSNLAKSVILTGSMIPLETPVTDAKRNLIISMMSSVNLDIPEVCIFFSNQLLRGNRSRKIDPGSPIAFQSPNFPALAEMGVSVFVDRSLVLPAPRRRFTVHTDLFQNIAVMWLIPGFDDTCISAFLRTSTFEKPVALVLQLYGTGNAPTHKRVFVDTLREGIHERGAVICATSQCLRGNVDMQQYATGNVLHEMGVIDGRDMTVESCVTKLSFLMGRLVKGEIDRTRMKVLMETPLRGELTLRHTQAYNVNEINVFAWDANSTQSSLLSSANSKRQVAQSEAGLQPTPLPKIKSKL